LSGTGRSLFGARAPLIALSGVTLAAAVASSARLSRHAAGAGEAGKNRLLK
jgi:hypothetical protein